MSSEKRLLARAGKEGRDFSPAVEALVYLGL